MVRRAAAAALARTAAAAAAARPGLAQRRWCRLGVAAAAIGVALLANLALYRHDVHFDATRTARYTAPPELAQVVAALSRDVSVAYFYNDADGNARAAKEALTVLARRQARLRLRAVDLDREPDAARAAGVRAYNTFVIAAGERRVQVENTVDLRQLAYGLLRAQKEREQLVCFVTGHGEPYLPEPPHLHYAHVETLQGHEVPGAGDVVVGAGDGLDRLRLALGDVGYADRAIVLATIPAVPEDCAVVAAIGPRRPFAPGEAARLEDYLARGGRLLLMLDPGAPVEAGLRQLLARLGVEAEAGVVTDPVNHYGTEENRIAVPWYPPHPITDRIAMTVFADARPLRLSPPPEGVQAALLVGSSQGSLRRPVRADAAVAGDGGTERGAATLAVALQGHWPEAREARPFRLVVAGNSAFATNAWFPVVANGELAVSMVRWLAADTDTPRIRPAAYSLPEITLTHRQMQAIFLVIEVLLPLSVVLAGALVWWRRR